MGGPKILATTESSIIALKPANEIDFCQIKVSIKNYIAITWYQIVYTWPNLRRQLLCGSRKTAICVIWRKWCQRYQWWINHSAMARSPRWRGPPTSLEV